MGDFRPHEIEWTREKAARFWRFLSSKSVETDYFSEAVGRSLIAVLQRHDVSLAGRVLDYGCGPGYLLQALLRAGAQCEGADFDTNSLERATVLVGREPGFRGVTLLTQLPSQLPTGAYDLVLLVETLEHLLPDDLTATMAELCRLLRDGAHIVVTTPNDEPLDANKTMCPECGSVFHLVQHVSSWTQQRLSRHMRELGFDEVMCAAMTLRRPSPLNWARQLHSKIRRRRPPHLVYIGRKRTSQHTVGQ